MFKFLGYIAVFTALNILTIVWQVYGEYTATGKLPVRAARGLRVRRRINISLRLLTGGLAAHLLIVDGHLN